MEGEEKMSAVRCTLSFWLRINSSPCFFFALGLHQLLCPQLFFLRTAFIPSGMGVEEVGHAPHSSLWRQGVWIGSLYNTSRGWVGGEVAHISLLITEERQAERGETGRRVSGSTALGNIGSTDRYGEHVVKVRQGQVRLWGVKM